MLKHFSCSVIISKKKINDSFCFSHSICFRERVQSVLAKIDSTNDSNHTYAQLIRILSLPLNRLEKYANLLKEYLHNLEVDLFIFS